jgi:hypothetical protein
MSIISVNASEFCRNQVCTNNIYYANGLTEIPTSLEPDTAYSSFISNTNAISGWAECDTNPFSLSAVGGRLNGNDLSDNQYVIKVSDTCFEIVSTHCQTIVSQCIANDIININIGDYDLDLKQDIIVMTNQTVELYSMENEILVHKGQIIYNSTGSGYGTYGSCTNTVCFIREYNDNSIYVISLTSGISAFYENSLAATSTAQFGRFASGKINGQSYAFICSSLTGGSVSFKCEMMNNTGGIEWSSTLLSASGNVATPDNFDTYIIYDGSKYVVIASGCVEKTASACFYYIYNQYGSVLTSLIAPLVSGVLKPTMSELAFGNYDINGNIEYCYMNNYSQPGVNFVCFDSQTYLTRYNFSINTLSNMTGANFSRKTLPTRFFMADIGLDYLALGTYDGVYYVSQTELKDIYRISIWSNATNDTTPESGGTRHEPGITSILNTDLFNTPPTTPYYWAGQPTFALSSTSSGIIIIPEAAIGSVCGNGVQEYGETILSCPQDCIDLTGTGTDCLANSSCPASYPVCLNGKCVSGFNASRTCNYDNDCAYNEICYSHYCIDAVSGGYTQNQSTILSSSTDDMFNRLTSGSEKIKWILGLIMVIIITSGVAGALWSVGLRSGIGWGVFLGMFLGIIGATVFGLFPIYILILYILLSLGMSIVVFKMSQSGGG